MSSQRFSIAWHKDGAVLCAREPTVAELTECAPRLSAWYNDEYNGAMMTNDASMSAADVCALYQQMSAAGGRQFLLYRDGELMGDADFRRIGDGAPVRAEFAIMVGVRSAQGKGVGTAFSVLLHAFAFQKLGLREIYLTIIPENEAGRRCYKKVGYACDEGPVARSYAEHDTDVAMVLTREAFLRHHGTVLSQIEISARPESPR